MRILTRLVLAAAVVAVLAAPAGGATPKAHPLRILVSNDDGVKAPGIDALVQALRRQKNVKVTVVAPLMNQSGTGGKTTAGALTATHTTTKSGYPAIAVNGFPADSVIYALHKVVHRSDVDLVIAGINQGANLGPFVNLSGTVGAARAGAQAGIPALATSEGTPTTTDFSAGVASTIAWLKANRKHLKPGVVHNLNIPQCSTGHVRRTVAVASSPTLPAGVNPFVTVDCTQTAGPAIGDVDAYLQGFATLTTIPKTPPS
jgi:5'-nucleotidase